MTETKVQPDPIHLTERQRLLYEGLARRDEMLARIYLSSRRQLRFSRMHKEVFAALASLVNKRAGGLAIAAPRDRDKRHASGAGR